MQTNPTLHVYGIAQCDTVKKAKIWLTGQGLAFDFHDFKKSPPTEALLGHWSKTLSWSQLINQKGTTWRKLPSTAQARAAEAAGAMALALQWPSLIKRPVVVWPNGAVSCGFDPLAWAAQLVTVNDPLQKIQDAP